MTTSCWLYVTGGQDLQGLVSFCNQAQVDYIIDDDSLYVGDAEFHFSSIFGVSACTGQIKASLDLSVADALFLAKSQGMCLTDGNDTISLDNTVVLRKMVDEMVARGALHCDIVDALERRGVLPHIFDWRRHVRPQGSVMF